MQDSDIIPNEGLRCVFQLCRFLGLKEQSVISMTLEGSFGGMISVDVEFVEDGVARIRNYQLGE